MRLEAAFAQQPTAQPTARPGGFTTPGGTVVDPAPFPGGGWVLRPRPVPRPVVDPAPWPYGHWPPHVVVDPAPWPPNVVVDPAPSPWPNPIADPAPSVENLRATAAAQFGRIGHIGDPAPIDISRLSVSQLESMLHTINAERSRLDSMETMIKQRFEQMKRQDEAL